MSSREHCHLLEKLLCKMYVCVCEWICECVHLCCTSSGESLDCVCLHGACVPVRLACLTGRATDWAAHTHISKGTFDVAELYLAASSGGDFSRVTISKRRQPQCLSTFSPFYMGHGPVVQISDSQSTATSVKCKNSDLRHFKVYNHYLQ